jgi:hypothetical protein
MDWYRPNETVLALDDTSSQVNFSVKLPVSSSYFGVVEIELAQSAAIITERRCP